MITEPPWAPVAPNTVKSFDMLSVVRLGLNGVSELDGGLQEI